MPMLPPKPCSKPGCPGYAKKLGRCEKHQTPAAGVIVHDIQPKPWGTTTTSRHARGYGKQWQVARLAALRRDSFLCVSCKSVGIVNNASEVDHIKPKSEGGDNGLDNLQSLCGRCHKEKTQADNKRIRKEKTTRGEG